MPVGQADCCRLCCVPVLIDSKLIILLVYGPLVGANCVCVSFLSYYFPMGALFVFAQLVGGLTDPRQVLQVMEVPLPPIYLK